MKKENHYEIFKGTTTNYTEWLWEPITTNSFEDNIRPIVCESKMGEAKAIVWLQGQMKSFKDFNFKLVGFFEDLNDKNFSQ